MFSSCSEISDEGIESLAGTLTKHFGQLLKLSLDFRESKRFSFLSVMFNF